MTSTGIQTSVAFYPLLDEIRKMNEFAAVADKVETAEELFAVAALYGLLKSKTTCVAPGVYCTTVELSVRN